MLLERNRRRLGSTLTVKRCGLRTSPIGSSILGSPVSGSIEPYDTPQPTLSNFGGENAPGKHIEHNLDRMRPV